METSSLVSFFKYVFNANNAARKRLNKVQTAEGVRQSNKQMRNTLKLVFGHAEGMSCEVQFKFIRPDWGKGYTRAGIAHLWFESTHPFEDGNGRIGRAVAESTLARTISTPTFSALSKLLLRHRKNYCAKLEAASTTLAIDDWLSWFADRALEAQKSADKLVRFLIEKTRFMDRLRNALNERQEKVLLRMLAEGPDGFTGAKAPATTPRSPVLRPRP